MQIGIQKTLSPCRRLGLVELLSHKQINTHCNARYSRVIINGSAGRSTAEISSLKKGAQRENQLQSAYRRLQDR
jgi:hypothetical protein